MKLKICDAVMTSGGRKSKDDVHRVLSTDVRMVETGDMDGNQKTRLLLLTDEREIGDSDMAEQRLFSSNIHAADSSGWFGFSFS